MSVYTYLLFEDLIERSSELGQAFYYKVNLDSDDRALDYGLYLGDCFAADTTPDLNIGLLDEEPSEMYPDGKTPKYFKSYSFSKFYADKIARLGAHLNSSITDSALDVDQIYDDLEEQAYIGFIMKEGDSQPLFMNSFFKSISPKKSLFKKREKLDWNDIRL